MKEQLGPACLTLLRDPSFRRPMILLAAAQAGASVYLAGASPIYIQIHGFTPWVYSVAFAANAVGMIALAQANRRLILRLGMGRTALAGAALGVIAILPPTLAALGGRAELGLTLTGFFFYFAAFGLVMGPASVMAMQRHTERTGLAAALLGTVQFGCGAVAAAVAGAAFDGTARPALSLMSVSAVAALLAALRARAS